MKRRQTSIIPVQGFSGLITAKLRKFVGKTPEERWLAIKATIRYHYQRHQDRHYHRALAGAMAIPQVLRSHDRLYVAHRPDWDVDFGRLPELRQLSDNWILHNFQNNVGDLPRLYALLLNIDQVMRDGVPGDFAELGVYRGNSAAVLAHYGRNHNRSVFLFDTYEGFEQRDLTGIDSQKRTVFEDTSLGMVQQNVGEGSIFYIKGYFPDSLTREIRDRRFAVVHLDCDLYAPIKAGLEFFYDRLSPGGLLIVHDYANPCWEGTKAAVDEFAAHIAEGLIVLPDKSGTAMIRKRR